MSTAYVTLDLEYSSTSTSTNWYASDHSYKSVEANEMKYKAKKENDVDMRLELIKKIPTLDIGVSGNTLMVVGPYDLRSHPCTPFDNTIIYYMNYYPTSYTYLDGAMTNKCDLPVGKYSKALLYGILETVQTKVERAMLLKSIMGRLANGTSRRPAIIAILRNTEDMLLELNIQRCFLSYGSYFQRMYPGAESFGYDKINLLTKNEVIQLANYIGYKVVEPPLAPEHNEIIVVQPS
jgi:hypothetical protein